MRPLPEVALDHVVIATRDLRAAMETYGRLGFDVAYGGEHPHNGTANAIMRFGLEYLELLGVERPVADMRPRGRELIGFLDATGGGLINFCLRGAALADVQPCVPGTPPPGRLSRRLPTGDELHWRMLLPGGSNCRRTWPFFIEWITPARTRLAREPSRRHPNTALRMSVVVVAAWLPDSVAALYRLLGLQVDDVARLSHQVEATPVLLSNARIELASPRTVSCRLGQSLSRVGEGPYAITIEAESLDAVTRTLDHNDVRYSSVRDTVVVDPRDAEGALIAFVEEHSGSADTLTARFEDVPFPVAQAS